MREVGRQRLDLTYLLHVPINKRGRTGGGVWAWITGENGAKVGEKGRKRGGTNEKVGGKGEKVEESRTSVGEWKLVNKKRGIVGVEGEKREKVGEKKKTGGKERKNGGKW